MTLNHDDIAKIDRLCERAEDIRDLNILRAYDMGATKASLVRAYGVTLHHINKLLKEAGYDLP